MDEGARARPAASDFVAALRAGDPLAGGAQIAEGVYCSASHVASASVVNRGVAHSVYISDPNGYGVEILYALPSER